MSGLFWTHLALTVLVSSLVGFFESPQSALSYFIGSALALGNVLVVFYFVRRIFNKKQVAMVSVVIIFKYLILGLIIYFIATKTETSGFWLCAGLISIFLTLGKKLRMREGLLLAFIFFGATSAIASEQGAHFSWTNFIPGVEENHLVHVATMALVSIATLLLAFFARIKLGQGEAAVTPEAKLSVRGFFEVVLEFINGLSDMVIGHEGRKFAPMFASVFLFIFMNNIVGLLPGMTAPTDNLNSGLALGLFSFFVYNYYGIKENGFGYIKHFMANMTSGVWLIFGLLLLVLELISHLVRPFSLGLRLMANLQGDHTILGVFTDLVPIGVPVAFYVLGLFVCFMQAFIFTVLSMVYISIATAHDH